MTGALWAQYHVMIAFAALMVVEILFLPETLYPRDTVVRMVENGEGLDSLPRTKTLGLWVSKRQPVSTCLFESGH